MGDMVSYRSNGATSEGYLALPGDAGSTGTAANGAAVVVIQEWWGLVPHVRELADRFAEAGFVALAPDLFHGVQTSEPDAAGKLMMGLAMDQAAKDMAARPSTSRSGRTLPARSVALDSAWAAAWPCGRLPCPIRSWRRSASIRPCPGSG